MNAHEIVAIDIIPIELPLIEPFIISYGAAAKVDFDTTVPENEIRLTTAF